MRKTGFLYDERYLLHDTGTCHPEVPARIQAVYDGIKDGGLLSGLSMIKASHADQMWIEAVHNIKYIQRFEEACFSGMSEFDHPDNQICPKTFETAMLAVGGILEAARLVMNGEIDNAFCAVRPPGHHAEADKAMGFCFFNNVAIAAKYIQDKYSVKKIGIIDFDVHHGNGTQSVFEQDPSVFYCSIHEHPSFAYPGTGREFEEGVGAGLGFTINAPMLPGQGDSEYKKIIKNKFLPAFEVFRPEVIIVSAGFDAHVDDDMSGIRLSSEGFSWIMKKIVEMADRYSNGRLISVLEGGYSLERLPELSKNHVEILLDK